MTEAKNSSANSNFNGGTSNNRNQGRNRRNRTKESPKNGTGQANGNNPTATASNNTGSKNANSRRNNRNNNKGNTTTSNNNSNNYNAFSSQQRPKQPQQPAVPSQPPPPRPLPPPPPPSSTGQPKKQNGEKGADAHTVSEADRIRWTQSLLELREQGATSSRGNDVPRLEFPSTLTNTERKFVHQLASQLGLVSKSTGMGDDRRIAVTLKKNDMVRSIVGSNNAHDSDGVIYDDVSNIPLLQVGTQAVRALQQHIQRYPPSPTEQLESRETGSSLAQAMQQQGPAQQGAAAHVMDQLKHLTDGDDNRESHRAAPKPRVVNLEKRRRNYSHHQARKRQQIQPYQRMIQHRSQLPAYSHQQEIIATVHEHAVTIISGPTGCGKSTQVPQFLLDDPRNAASNMVVTQPRRLAAIAIAERVAEEQLQANSTKGDNNNWIGYQVRLESNKSDQTQVLFLTPGVLLRQLQSDPFLMSYTHIIMDEIHERDKYQEFLLIVLRDLLPKRPELRLILMSATLQTMELVGYFQATSEYHNLQPPAVIEMQGRTFPVEQFFLEHVLDMTKYIQVEEIHDGDGNGEAHMIATAMTAEQLEAELARFTAQEPTTTNATVDDETLQCALCQRTDFADEADMLGHVMVCTGNANETIHDMYDSTAPSGPLFGSINEYNSNNNHTGGDHIAIHEMEFEDYDVDEDLEFQDASGDILQLPQKKNLAAETDSVEEIKDGSKWDGLSPFREIASDGGGSDILGSKKEDALLTQYQAMHDDETIDYYLLLHTIQYIVDSSYGDGAVLVFLPGWQEISEFTLLLEVSAPFSNRSKYSILPLHSGIQSRDQRKVLQRPPRGMRKIVLSTNLAETSLTIDDVAFVVDTGRAKEKSYDPHLKTSTLQPTWISQASAKQRMGRAGRTKAGVCFRLFSKRRYHSMRPFVESELLRTPLEEMCLMCKKLGLAPGGCEDDDGVPAFLAKAMSTPHAKSVTNALELLVDLGAMQPETNALTNLGDCLSMLSLEPRVGKMVIWSYLLGCSRVASNMAVAMSYKSPFTLPPNHLRKAADEAKVRMSQRSESDQVTVHFALEYREQFFRNNNNSSGYTDFCRRNFLSPATMQMISDMRKNLIRELAMIGLPSPSLASQQPRNQNNDQQKQTQTQNYHNRHDNDHALWQAAIAAGLYPNVASRQRDDVNFSTMTNQKVKVHISSVNAVRGQPLNAKCQIPKGQVEFVCFGEMVKGTAQFFTVNQTAHLASPLPLLLLCGTSLSVRPVRLAPPPDESQPNNKPRGRNNQSNSKLISGSLQEMALLSMDDWIVFQCDADTAANIVILRRRLENAFWNALKNPKAAGKNMMQSLTQVERDAVEIVGAVLQSAHHQSEKAQATTSVKGGR